MTCAFRRVRFILQIFHKPNKLVGVVKCTDHMRVMTKRISDTVCFKLKVVELAEATSNKNAWDSTKGLCGIGERKDGVKSNVKSNATYVYSVKFLNLIFLH